MIDQTERSLGAFMMILTYEDSGRSELLRVVRCRFYG